MKERLHVREVEVAEPEGKVADDDVSSSLVARDDACNLERCDLRDWV